MLPEKNGLKGMKGVEGMKKNAILSLKRNS